MSFTADDIIGKTLIANTKVPISRTAMDGSPVVFEVKAGQPVGVVEGYVVPKSGRTRLWWQFKDEKGRSYFAEHLQGRYDMQNLKQQGVKTTEQKKEDELRKDETLTDKAERLLKNGFMIGAGVYLIAQFINKK